MRNFFLPILFVILMTVLSSCQGFLDDYSYQPLGGGYPVNSNY